MRIAVIGATGQLGTDVVKVLGRDHDVVGLSHGDLDVIDRDAVAKHIADIEPDAVVNTAAFHRVDDCEDDPDRAFAVNFGGALNIARACESVAATSVYVSTDYVFDGSKDGPYDETDEPRPINVYGISKVAGELATMTYADSWVVVRVSSLFGSAGASGKGGNFVETILSKARAGEPLKVVDDITMSPTYTGDAATRLKRVLEAGTTGVFHLSNEGQSTWHEFATEIVRSAGLDVDVAATRSHDYPSKARRPANSALETARLDVGERSRTWSEGLAAYLEEKGHPRATGTG